MQPSAAARSAMCAAAAGAASPREVCVAALLIDTWRAALCDLVPRASATHLCATTCAYWGFRLATALPYTLGATRGERDAAVYRIVGIAAQLSAALIESPDGGSELTARGLLSPVLALYAIGKDTALQESSVDAMVAAVFAPLRAVAAQLHALWARTVGDTDVLELSERIGLLAGLESDAAPPGRSAAHAALSRMYSRLGGGAPGAGRGGECVREPGDAGRGDPVLFAGALPGAAEPRDE